MIDFDSGGHLYTTFRHLLAATHDRLDMDILYKVHKRVPPRMLTDITYMWNKIVGINQLQPKNIFTQRQLTPGTHPHLINNIVINILNLLDEYYPEQEKTEIWD